MFVQKTLGGITGLFLLASAGWGAYDAYRDPDVTKSFPEKWGRHSVETAGEIIKGVVEGFGAAIDN